MALTRVTSQVIKDNTILGIDIVDNSVGLAKLEKPATIQPGDVLLVNDQGDFEFATQTLDSLDGVTTAGAEPGDVLTWNGSVWESSAPTGSGTGSTATDLDSLLGVTISNPVTGQYLRYDAGNWVNQEISYNDIQGAPTIPSSITALSDVNTTTAVTEDFLQFDGVNWLPTQLVFSDLTDINISGATADQVLKFNGTNWLASDFNLENLSNVNTTNLQNGQVLKWNSATSQWEPSNDNTGTGGASEINGLSDVTVTVAAGLNQNEALVWNGSVWANAPLTTSMLTDYDPNAFSTSAQGVLADSAVQPGDNISTLTNDAGYLTSVPSSALNDLSDVTTIGATTGQVLKFTGSGWTPQNDNSTGEINTASSLGTGNAVYAAKIGSDLQFKSLVAGSGVSLASDANTITITSTATGGGEINTASNVGTGNAVFKQKTGADLEFKTLIAGSNITITGNADELTINSTATGGTVINSITDITDVFNTAIPSSYLRWNASGTGVVFETTIPAAVISGLGTVATTGSYNDLTDIPTTFTPSAHTHVKSDITDFNEADYATAAQGTLAGTATQPGDNISTLTNDAGYLTSIGGNISQLTNDAGYLTSVPSSALNDLTDVSVVGATTGQVLKFDGTSWTAQADLEGAGGVTSYNDLIDVPTTFTPSAHTHVKADITDLNEADYATAAQGTLADSAIQATDSIGVLSDVNLTGLIDGNILAYNSTSGSFEPVSPSTGGTGEINTASNLGTGNGVFASKIGEDLQFKSLVAGTNVSFTSTGTEITINSTGTGGVTSYNDLTDVPTTFTPSAHTHVKADITDFNEADYATAAQGTLADSATQPGDNISTLTNDAGYLTSVPSSALNDLTDVSTAGATTGQVLKFNGTSWAPQADLEGTGSGATTINDLTDVDTTTVAPADGNVLTYSSATSEWVPAVPTGGSSGGGTTTEWVVLQMQSGNTINPALTTNSTGVTVSTYDGSSACVTGFTFSGYNMPPAQVIVYAQRVSVGDWIATDASDFIDTPMKISDAAGATTSPELIDFNSPFTGEVTMGLPITNTGVQNAGLPVKYGKLLVIFTMAG